MTLAVTRRTGLVVVIGALLVACAPDNSSHELEAGSGSGGNTGSRAGVANAGGSSAGGVSAGRDPGNGGNLPQAGMGGSSSGDGAGGSAGGGEGGVTLTLGPLKPREQWPKTIPSVREWHEHGNAAGSFILTSESKIVLPEGASASLSTTADVLADDVLALKGWRPAVVMGTPVPGDVALAVDLDDIELGSEGYVLLIDDHVGIHAPSDGGAFWATRTLLQLITSFGELGIPSGAARDYPAYAERGFMIDNGRTYFSPAWLKSQIRQLSYLKLNLFHWHLSDGEGFRIESKSHPEVVSSEHLTRAQVAEIVEIAAKYHVEIVPEIDVPGHMDAVLSQHPDLIASQDTYHFAQVDYTKPEGRALVRELIEDVIDLFPGRYFHLGADEFTPYYDAAWQYAQAKYGNNPEIGGMDVAIEFVNELAALVGQHQKTARVWNDVLAPSGVVEKLDQSILIESWIDRGTSSAQFSAAGFSLLNCNWQCTYFKDEDTILSPACAPTVFADGTEVPAASVRGMKYHVWCDPAEEFCPSGSAVADGVRLPLRALAESTWGAPRLTADVAELRELSETIGNAPGGP